MSNSTGAASTSASAPEETTAALTSDQMIERLVESAALLISSEQQLTSVNILEKLVDEVNRDLTNRLIKMVNLTSTHVVESNLINRGGGSAGSHVENNPKFLCQLIELTFEQFKYTARLYRHFIECAVAKLSSIGPVARYQWSNIWTCIQNVLIQLLDEYLDIRQLNQAQNSGGDFMDKIDINAFFVRKRLINLTFGGDSSAPSSNAAATTAETDADEKDHRRLFTFKGS